MNDELKNDFSLSEKRSNSNERFNHHENVYSRIKLRSNQESQTTFSQEMDHNDSLKRRRKYNNSEINKKISELVYIFILFI